MSQQAGGAAVVAALEAVGVDLVFGITGTHNLEIYRALATSSITHVTPRHEQGAGYAADGYARVGGRPAACVTTGGPGLTNIVTAVATAHADSVPLLVIAPGAPRGTEGADLGLLHEVRDQRGLMGSVVNHAVRATSPEHAAAAIQDAVVRMQTGRPRPEYVEIPVDVLEEPWDDGSLPSPSEKAVPQPDAAAIARAVELLAGAYRPVIVAGGGSRRAGADLLALAERLRCPVITTVNGKGVVSEHHPLSLGSPLRLRAATPLIEAADVALLVGTEFADTDLWDQTVDFAGAVIRVDIDADQLQKNVRADVALHGDAAQVLDLVLSALGGRSLAGDDQRGTIAAVRDDLSREAAADGAVWRDIQTAVRAGVDRDVIVAGDSAMVSYFGTVHHWPMSPRDRFIYPTGYATLGYGLPAAIGARCARPDAATLVLVGDGGFMFSVPELMTAVENRMPLPIIVVNNGGYRAIRDQMVERQIEPMGVDLTQPDFAALSRACGGRGVTIDGLDGLTDSIADALDAAVPTVIEVVI
jgi:thiamine pyrophosphate-dependent acetolactate synthase large subunit-like protein